MTLDSLSSDLIKDKFHDYGGVSLLDFLPILQYMVSDSINFSQYFLDNSEFPVVVIFTFSVNAPLSVSRSSSPTHLITYGLTTSLFEST